MGHVDLVSTVERARTSFREVVGIGDRWCTASALWGLGWIDDLAGNARGAVRCYREALEIWNETGDRRGVFYAIQGVAIVAARTGAQTTAARLFAGAETIGPDVGSGSMPEWNVWRDQHLEELRDALTAADFAVSWAAVRAPTMAEAMWSCASTHPSATSSGETPRPSAAVATASTTTPALSER